MATIVCLVFILIHDVFSSVLWPSENHKFISTIYISYGQIYTYIIYRVCPSWVLLTKLVLPLTKNLPRTILSQVDEVYSSQEYDLESLNIYRLTFKSGIRACIRNSGARPELGKISEKNRFFPKFPESPKKTWFWSKCYKTENLYRYIQKNDKNIQFSPLFIVFIASAWLSVYIYN